jgi:hypothetical protein
MPFANVEELFHQNMPDKNMPNKNMPKLEKNRQSYADTTFPSKHQKIQ